MMNHKKGFNLIELMVVIAIIAILASLALPMYSTYKRRLQIVNSLKGISEAKQGFQQYYQEFQDFQDLTFDATGVAFHQATQRAGFSLASVNDVTYTKSPVSDADNLIVDWVFDATSGCFDCDGRWCIECDGNRCWTSTQIDTNDVYRLDATSDISGDNACS